MTRPTHYSVQIAQRCQHLIDRLIDRVGTEPDLADERGDPLRTTFLLAMSTPMLVLPIERLIWRAFRDRSGVADDAEIDEVLSVRMGEVAGERLFGATPFCEPGAWSYVEAVPRFPVARDWPDDVLDSLDHESAVLAAEKARAATILTCLRNALAHGGITYLDRTGRQREEETSILTFAAYPGGARRQELSLLRISVDAYQRFLTGWNSWIAESGIQESLTIDGPGWLAGTPKDGAAADPNHAEALVIRDSDESL